LKSRNGFQSTLLLLLLLLLLVVVVLQHAFRKSHSLIVDY